MPPDKSTLHSTKAQPSDDGRTCGRAPSSSFSLVLQVSAAAQPVATLAGRDERPTRRKMLRALAVSRQRTGPALEMAQEASHSQRPGRRKKQGPGREHRRLAGVCRGWQKKKKGYLSANSNHTTHYLFPHCGQLQKCDLCLPSGPMPPFVSGRPAQLASPAFLHTHHSLCSQYITCTPFHDRDQAIVLAHTLLSSPYGKPVSTSAHLLLAASRSSTSSLHPPNIHSHVFRTTLRPPAGCTALWLTPSKPAGGLGGFHDRD